MHKFTTRPLRIIAGKWRGRKIYFPDVDNVRPTSNRVRETLFNWLMPYIHGAYCLDLFAGSGALGFEALSRGAEHVVMVDQSPVIIEQLRMTAEQLHTTQLTLCIAEVPHSLVLPRKPFDIIFLDPPFDQPLIQLSNDWLQKNDFIHKKTLIYIETARAISPLPLPAHWQIFKSGQTQQVAYYLVRLDNT